jgi:hypothetical protein
MLFFAKVGCPKVEFGNSRDSRKTLYSHRTVDLEIMAFFPILTIIESIT